MLVHDWIDRLATYPAMGTYWQRRAMPCVRHGGRSKPIGFHPGKKLAGDLESRPVANDAVDPASGTNGRLIIVLPLGNIDRRVTTAAIEAPAGRARHDFRTMPARMLMSFPDVRGKSGAAFPVLILRIHLPSPLAAWNDRLPRPVVPPDRRAERAAYEGLWIFRLRVPPAPSKSATRGEGALAGSRRILVSFNLRSTIYALQSSPSALYTSSKWFTSIDRCSSPG